MKLDKIENKNRRLRKKLYLGEFAIQGFAISCATSIKEFKEYDQFVDEFVDFIDSIELSFGGGGLELFDGFLCSIHRYESATEEQKEKVATWLSNHPLVSKVEVSDLMDANYIF
ncbi:YggL family protein [Vibrio sp. SS-MA-C1-2]|uniref:YggL 50S ribosome-binding family protein n=1 Tax=Vibrio sp. SS-MA-C1-2 TaxID=2908646 RepID=UPI001F294D83|nr:YggL family protein [Vibrio sp. SS-MA-C1-2]UJF17995.1 YggL family protein [Vibrio sp. SS-MA-C1-2]